jgi:tetratricopeptide (TPR) repeat protein
MKQQFIFIAAFLCLLIIIGCGKPPMEKGDEAFKQQKYSEALKYYLEAVKEMPDNNVLKEKIATTYFKQGEIFWEKRRILRGIEARVNSGLSYVPENPTPEMKKTISETYLTLALAYKNAKAENPFQKRQFFNKALESLEQSLLYDSTNTEANNTLAQFKDENFQEMLDKGISTYRRGSRDRLQYIAADYYLTNALKLDPENEDAKRYLRLSRQKSLDLLDPGQNVPIAVTDQMENTEYMAYLVAAYNQMPDPITISASNLYLIRKNGAALQGKISEMFSTPFNTVTISNGEETGGVVAFSLPNTKDYIRLELRKDGDVLGYKNLP